MRALRLVFMGTPAFALPALKSLHASDHQIVGLVTQPDRPHGRGRQLNQPPTKEWAIKKGIEIFQPSSLKQPEFINWLKNLSPDLIVTVAYGRLLTEQILDLPPLGCINLHASYLPAYRGSAPIHRAIIDGAAASGVSIIELTPELDAGDVIMKEKEIITDHDNAGTLHDRLALLGAKLLVQAVDALAAGQAKKTPQDDQLATYAPPLTPEDEVLDWNRSAVELYNQIRGLNPWPGAYTKICDKRIKVWQASLSDINITDQKLKVPGTIVAIDEKSLTVATGKGAITLLNLQPAGKKAMDASSFCCGYRVVPGERLGED